MEIITNDHYIKKGKYQLNLNDDSAQCLTCERRCVIQKGAFGYCNTRYNKNGIIYSILYGCNAALSNNPIEKKLLFI